MKVAPRVLAVGAAIVVLSSCGTAALPLLPSARGMGAEDARSSAMSASPYFSVRFRLADDFSSAVPDKASAYELGHETEGSTVGRVARAFGIGGRPQSTPTEWVVAGGGLTLRVSKAGGVPFAVNGDHAVSSGYACAEAPSGGSAADDSTSTAVPAPDAPRCEEPAVNPDLPTKSDAEDSARRLLRAAGVDLGGAVAATDGGYDSWTSTFTLRVGGVRATGLTASVTVGPKGRVLAASGMLAKPEAVGEYPLVAPGSALDRLNEQADAGAKGGPEPAIATDVDCDDAATSCVAPPVSGDGTPSEPQSRELVVTKADLSLISVGGHEPGAPLHLVPAYAFTTEDGAVVEVEAVTDKYLTKPVASAPPTADPGDGGTGLPPQDGESCSAQTPGSAPAAPGETPNAGLSLEVCASDTKAKVGEEITFRVTAKDPDGSFVEGPCETPVTARFGDEGSADGETVNCMACAQATEGRHEHRTSLTHTYQKPGTYEVVFDVRSGSKCDPRPGDSKGTITIAVEVTAG